MTDLQKLKEACREVLLYSQGDPELTALGLAEMGIGFEHKVLYEVEIKLTEPRARHVYKKGWHPYGYIHHNAFGWYTVGVFADSEEEAELAARQHLQIYKNATNNRYEDR